MRWALVVVLCGLVVLEGCAGGSISEVNPAGAAASGASGARLTGSVHGGQQPINGAHVYLLEANTALTFVPENSPLVVPNGQTSVSLLDPAQTGAYDSVGAYVTTNANGNFTFNPGEYSCTPGAQVYLYAQGGNPGAGPNSAAALMAVLGSCPAAGNFTTAVPFISVNEVSTIAAAYAMADFATDATHVWMTGTTPSQTGVANAFANAANLVNIGTGAASTTAPQTEVDTLGNILAACVNSTGPTSSFCTTLFSNALSAGSSGTMPSDTATAAINIAHNATSNVVNLFRLSDPTAPFQPSLTSAPADFTIPLVATPTPAPYFRNSLNSSTVFLGDSITQYWNLPLNNSGVAEEYTSDMLARFSTDVLGHGYKRVVILGGTNDIWLKNPADPATAVQNVETMAQMGRAAGLEVVLCTLTANLENPGPPDFFAPLYAEFDQPITAFAMANNYPLVDYYTLTVGHPEYYPTNDKVHPNELGYAVMEAALASVVTQ